MAGLVPAIPLRRALCSPHRDRRVKPGDDNGWCGTSDNDHLPQTSSASSTIIRSLAHCSSSASTLPSSVEAKPHCGERQSWSSATYLVASSMRRLIESLLSSL